MGAFQSFSNKINPFEIRIDSTKCKECDKCVHECPTFSLDSASIEAGKARMNCVKCGKCIDVCATGAIGYHVKGTAPMWQPARARLLFLYPAFLFMTVFGSGMIQDGMYRVLLLVTTGSMIQ
jgi:NAD-dependent dihydropyrimidine dehydrogenase PreA subunit